MQVRVYPSRAAGELWMPPSKSISHRALICACLAGGESRIFNLAHSEDIDATIGAMAALGASFAEKEDGALMVNGLSGLPDHRVRIDCCESGSTLRFLIPLCALTGAGAEFIGRGRLMSRPQEPYRDIFQRQNRTFSQTDAGITLRGPLFSGRYEVRGDISSQFITGLMLALPLLPKDSEVWIQPPFESRSYVNMTQKVMVDFGIAVYFREDDTLFLPGGQRYQPLEYRIEGDYSQMAFFGALGIINGNIVCRGLNHDTAQGDRVIVELLAGFGGNAKWSKEAYLFSKGRLHAQEVDLADCPDLGPILITAAAFAKGESRFVNAGRLRLKESDRIAAMEEELKKLNVPIVSDKNTVTMLGGNISSREGLVLSCHNDHRIAMSLAVAASYLKHPVVLDGAECVRKSYPNFFEDLKQVGIRSEIVG